MTSPPEREPKPNQTKSPESILAQRVTGDALRYFVFGPDEQFWAMQRPDRWLRFVATSIKACGHGF